MRLLPLLALCALCACSEQAPLKVPPVQRFYFPTGVAHVGDEGGKGRLFVASSDFDKRYDFGAVTMIDLDQVPALAYPDFLDPNAGAADGGTSGADAGVSSEVAEITDLGLDASKHQVFTAPFAGDMDVFRTADGTARIFLPTRAEGDAVYALDAKAGTLSCVGANADERNCTATGMSLTAPGLASRNEPKDGFVKGKPRAPEPYAVHVDQASGKVFFTHIDPADSPVDSNTAYESYLVVLDAADPKVTVDSFRSIGSVPASSVTVGSRYAFLSGRAISRSQPPAIRIMDLAKGAQFAVTGTPLENDFKIFEPRDVLLSADERRLFLVGRSPDMLLVVNVEAGVDQFPNLRVVRAVPLPDGPDQAVLIPRSPGRGALVAVTCTSGNSVALYDDEIGQLSTVVDGVGEQPFGIAVQRPDGARGARLFVTNFGDGQVAVIDIPNVDQPFAAQVKAKLGPRQTCLTDPHSADPCPEAQP